MYLWYHESPAHSLAAGAALSQLHPLPLGCLVGERVLEKRVRAHCEVRGQGEKERGGGERGCTVSSFWSIAGRRSVRSSTFCTSSRVSTETLTIVKG